MMLIDLILNLMLVVVIIALCCITTLAIKAYEACKNSEEGEITEIFSGVFNPLGIAVGIVNTGSGGWELEITRI